MLPTHLLVLLLASCHASIIDQMVLDEGKICSWETTTYSFDPAIGKGECCLIGQVYVDGVCQEPPSPASLSISTPVSEEVSAASCSSCPDRDPTASCPPDGTVGIRYGRCYTMTQLDGTPVTRGNPTWPNFYFFGKVNRFRNVVFRVCHNQTIAGCDSPQDEYVLQGASWYQLDESGTATTTDFAFVGTQLGGDGYYLVQTLATGQANIVDFTANVKCLYGQCFPCVKLYSKSGADTTKTNLGLFFESWPVYGGDGVVTTANNTNNTNTCVPIIYQQTSCLTQ